MKDKKKIALLHYILITYTLSIKNELRKPINLITIFYCILHYYVILYLFFLKRPISNFILCSSKITFFFFTLFILTFCSKHLICNATSCSLHCKRFIASIDPSALERLFKIKKFNTYN